MTIAKLANEPTATATAENIVSGNLSALEATEAAIARIEALNDPLNAVVVRDFDNAQTTAKRLDETGPGNNQPLFGVPMTVKESFDVAGLPSTWGLEHARNNIAESDSVVVQRLKKAGAVILGKTNVPPELADWQSNNPVYGRTSNPHDLDRTPGGSSGGERSGGGERDGAVRVWQRHWRVNPGAGALLRDLGAQTDF